MSHANPWYLITRDEINALCRFARCMELNGNETQSAHCASVRRLLTRIVERKEKCLKQEESR